MRHIFFILFPIFLSGFLFPEGTFATSAYIQNIEQMLSLGHKIDTEKRIDVRNALEQKRSAIMTETLRIQSSIKTRFTEKPTLDATSRYRLFFQKYALSCEIAALRSVLETIEKKIITEDAIFADFPIFSGPKKSGIWGDPDLFFVGDKSGKQSNTTGYGVYPQPIAAFLKTWEIPSWIYSDSDERPLTPLVRLTTILTSLESGYHVILWGDYCTIASEEDGIIGHTDLYVSRFLGVSAPNTCKASASARKLSWKTSDGKVIDGLSGEHAFVLLGYFGDITDPTHIIVWDTKTGRHIYRTSEWMRKWGLLSHRALVIDPRR